MSPSSLSLTFVPLQPFASPFSLDTTIGVFLSISIIITNFSKLTPSVLLAISTGLLVVICPYNMDIVPPMPNIPLPALACIWNRRRSCRMPLVSAQLLFLNRYLELKVHSASGQSSHHLSARV